MTVALGGASVIQEERAGDVATMEEPSRLEAAPPCHCGRRPQIVWGDDQLWFGISCGNERCTAMTRTDSYAGFPSPEDPEGEFDFDVQVEKAVREWSRKSSNGRKA